MLRPKLNYIERKYREEGKGKEAERKGEEKRGIRINPWNGLKHLESD